MNKSYLKIIDQMNQHDFDGHTDFDKLTPTQRIQWLADAAIFYSQTRTENQKVDNADQSLKSKIHQ